MMTTHPVIVRACAAFDVDLADLTGPSKARHLCEARNAAAWVLQHNYDFTVQRIGALLGRRDHATIINAIHRADELMRRDPRYTQRVKRVMEQK